MAKTVPFKALNNGEHLVEVAGLQWANLKPNLEEVWGQFKEKTFEFKYDALTGAVVDGRHWLIATLHTGACMPEGLFEFKIWGDKVDGKATIDKKAVEEHQIKWQKSGCLASILVDEIPQLATFAKVLNDFSVIIKNPIKVNLEMSAEDIKSLEEHLTTWIAGTLAAGKLDKGIPAYQSFKWLEGYYCGVAPIMKESSLPQIPVLDEFGSPDGTKPSCFPFEGELPTYSKLIWNTPTISVKKTGGGYGNGGGTTIFHGYLSPEDRMKFVIAQLKSAGYDLKSEDCAGIAQLVQDEKAATLFNVAMWMCSSSYHFPPA